MLNSTIRATAFSLSLVVFLVGDPAYRSPFYFFLFLSPPLLLSPAPSLAQPVLTFLRRLPSGAGVEKPTFSARVAPHRCSHSLAFVTCRRVRTREFHEMLKPERRNPTSDTDNSVQFAFLLARSLSMLLSANGHMIFAVTRSLLVSRVIVKYKGSYLSI